MKHTIIFLAAFFSVAFLSYAVKAEEINVRTMPPVVVKTVPQSGDTKVDPATKELRITFSKKMTTTDYTYIPLSDDVTPKNMGKPRFQEDKKTCSISVKLEPGQTYALWLNTEKFKNFKDSSGTPAIPYLLIFETKSATAAKAKE